MELENQDKIYNLQQLKKELLNLNLNQNYKFVMNEFNPMWGNIYGVFSADNSFMFAKELSCLGFNYSLSIWSLIEYVWKIIFGGAPLISKRYYLIDFFSRAIVSDKYDEKFGDGDIYEYNDKEHFVVLCSKVIPASFLTKIPLENIGIVQDAINVFLADNPEFIKQIFQDVNTKQTQTEQEKTKRMRTR